MVLSVYLINEFNFTSYTSNSLVQSLFFIPHENPAGIGVLPYLTVGWTLNYEIMFYTTLSLCLAFSKKFALMLTSIVIVVLLFLLRDVDIILVSVLKDPKMIQFICGVGVGWCYSKLILTNNMSIAIGFVTLFISLLFLSGVIGYSFEHKTIFATLIVFSFLLLNPLLNADSPYLKVFIKCGDYSYSTYLSHVLVIGIFLSLFGNQLTKINELLVLVGITFVTYFVSAFSYRWVENSKYIFVLRDLFISKFKVVKAERSL